MELALVAGVALAGWVMNTPPSKPASQSKPTIQPVSTGEGTPVSQPTNQASQEILKYNEGAIKRFTQSQFPERTGIIAPFYRDVRTQSTNAVTKQRTMESFTGDDQTWKPKREQESLFQPKPQIIDSSGRAGNTPTYDAEMYRQSVSNIQSGTFPFERQNIGRGLGIKPDEAAADNFHPMLRIIPPSGDLHKHHEMAGRVATTGATQVQERPYKPCLRHNRPPRVWTQERYPLAKGRATVTGPSHRGEHSSLVPPCHLDTEHRIGVAYREGGMPVQGNMTRVDDRTTSIDSTNLTGPAAVGGYVGAHFDTAKFESLDREAPGTILGAKYYNSSITKYSQDAPNDTIRQVTGVRFTGPGNVEPVVKGPKEYCSGLQLLKEAKRGAYVTTKHTPGAQRTAAYRQANLGLTADHYVQQQHKIRCQLRQPLSHAQADSSASRQITSTKQVGDHATTGKKYRAETNPRNDFGLAARVLQNNPYTIGGTAP